MGLTEIGLQAVFDTGAFEKGVGNYLNGLGKAEKKTNIVASALGTIGKVAGGVALAGIGAAAAAVGYLAKSGTDMNKMLEKTNLQFTTLMGSSQLATAHVKDLFKFAAETPFETEPILQASKNLLTFGGTALDTMGNLRMVGDAAAAVNVPIEEVSFWVGRAYSMIQAGKPFGEAAMRLQEMGILTASTRDQLEKMQDSGKKGPEVWAAFTGSLGRFNGAMKLQAGTWEGLMSTISDNVKMAGAVAFKPFFDLIKDGMGIIAQFVTSADISTWAATTGNILSGLIGFIKGMLAGDLEGAFVGLSDGIYKAFGPQAMKTVGEFKKGFYDFLQTIGRVKSFVNEITGSFAAVGGGFDGIMNVLYMLGEYVPYVNDIADAINAFVLGLQKVSLAGSDIVASPLNSFLNTFGTILRGIGTAIITVLIPAWNTMLTGVRQALPAFAPLLPALQQLWIALGPLFTALGAVLVGVLGVIIGVITGIATAIGPLITMIAGVITGVVAIITGAVQVITGVLNIIIGLITGNSQMVQAAWETMKAGAIRIFNGLVIAIISIMTGFVNTLTALIGGFIAGITGFFTTLYQSLVGGSIIPEMANAIIQCITDMITQLVTIFTAGLTQFLAVWKSNLDMLVKIIGTILNNALNTGRAYISKFVKMGADLILGLREGLEREVQSVYSWLMKMFNKIQDIAQKMMRIHSPSQVFAEIGVSIGEGLIQGMMKVQPNVQAALESLIGNTSRLGGIISAFFSYAGVGKDSGLSEKLKEQMDAIEARAEEIRGGKHTLDLEIDKQQQIFDLYRERDILAKQYAEEQAKITKQQEEQLRLQQAQAKLNFLQSQLDMIKLLKEHGVDYKKIMAGMKLGLEANGEDLGTLMTKAMETMVEKINQALGIASPSKVFAQIGSRMAQGMEVGFKGASPLGGGAGFTPATATTNNYSNSFTFNNSLSNGFDLARLDAHILQVVRSAL